MVGESVGVALIVEVLSDIDVLLFAPQPAVIRHNISKIIINFFIIFRPFYKFSRYIKII